MRGGVVTFKEQIQNGDIAAGSPADANDIGLPLSTVRCSAVTPTGNWTGGSGQIIACTLAGNPSIIGKGVTMTRDSEGLWSCSTTDLAIYRPNSCS